MRDVVRRKWRDGNIRKRAHRIGSRHLISTTYNISDDLDFEKSRIGPFIPSEFTGIPRKVSF
jgi:hypothetical protein